MLKNHAKIATPRIDLRKSLMWFSGVSRFLRNGRITSCMKMLPHECRYVLLVEMAAAAQTAASRPTIPVGSSLARPMGTVCWV